MWYVIQTTTGKEKELADVLRKYLNKGLYENCFVLERQLLKRLGGKWIKVTERLFPSYLFMFTRTPEPLFYELKRLPEHTKLLDNGEGTFIPLEKSEENFLRRLCNNTDGHLVKLSRVHLNQDGGIDRIDGPLQNFKKELLRINLRKRYAVIETSLRGKPQSIILGICLEKDE